MESAVDSCVALSLHIVRATKTAAHKFQYQPVYSVTNIIAFNKHAVNSTFTVDVKKTFTFSLCGTLRIKA